MSKEVKSNKRKLNDIKSNEIKSNKSNAAKSRRLPILAGAFVILLAVVFFATAEPENGTDNVGAGTAAKGTEAVGTAEGKVSYDIDGEGNLVIDKSNINGEAAFIDYNENGVNQQLFVVRASDDTVRVAFNTCQVCNGSPKAYFTQSGDILTCQNCGNRYLADQVGIERGGCNPIPIVEGDYVNSEENLVISADFMQENELLFKNWKR